jgi:hypothetical protein
MTVSHSRYLDTVRPLLGGRLSQHFPTETSHPASKGRA